MQVGLDESFRSSEPALSISDSQSTSTQNRNGDPKIKSLSNLNGNNNAKVAPNGKLEKSKFAKFKPDEPRKNHLGTVAPKKSDSKLKSYPTVPKFKIQRNLIKGHELVDANPQTSSGDDRSVDLDQIVYANPRYGKFTRKETPSTPLNDFPEKQKLNNAKKATVTPLTIRKLFNSLSDNDLMNAFKAFCDTKPKVSLRKPPKRPQTTRGAQNGLLNAEGPTRSPMNYFDISTHNINLEKKPGIKYVPQRRASLPAYKVSYLKR